MSHESNYTKGFLIGSLVGGVAGALTALLLAPKSGSELRKDIADTSTDWYGKASDYIHSVEGKVGSAIKSTMNEGKARAEGIITQAREKAETILKDAEEVLNDARTKASSAKSEVSDRISNVRDAARASVDAFKAELNSEKEG